MKKIAVIALAAVVFVSIAFLLGLHPDLSLFRSWFAVPSAGKPAFVQGPPLILGVEKLNELVTLRVRIKRNLSGENNWYKGLWEIEGDALFGADCSQALWSSIDPERKSLTVQLPRPRVIMARVDHEHTGLYDFRSISWNPAQLIWGNPDEIRDEAMKQAQMKLEKEAQSAEYLAQATQQAENNLKHFYTVLGWSLMVEWR